MSGSVSELCGYTALPEPDLVFAGGKTHKHPLLGLKAYGPYGLKFGAPSSCASRSCPEAGYDAGSPGWSKNSREPLNLAKPRITTRPILGLKIFSGFRSPNKIIA